MRQGSPAVPAIFAGAVAHQRAGRLTEAERLGRQALVFDPAHADSHHLLGVIAHRTARHGPALRLIQQAIRIDPSRATYHASLGDVLLATGRAGEAVGSYDRAIALDPDFAAAFNGRGKALRLLRRPVEALASYDRALALRPDDPELLNNSANALRELNRPAEALARYDRALAISPTYPEALSNRGEALRALGHPAEALDSYDAALALRPNVPGVLNNRANALRDLNRPAEALETYDRALAIRPDYAEAWNNRGAALRDLNRPEAALESYDRALEIRPDFAEAACNKGIVLTEIGRLGAADEALEAATKAAPGNARFYYNLALSRQITQDDGNLTAMLALARDMSSLDVNDQVLLHFALGRAFGDVGDHARSFRHFQDGNALARSRIAYDEASTLAALDRTRAAFSSTLMRRLQGAGMHSRTPVFIVGMPRSGSTLVEQILASHPSVFGAGEVDDFPRTVAEILGGMDGGAGAADRLSPDTLRRIGATYLDSVARGAGNAERITDKALGNFRLIGLVHLALPEARIIHTRRDPVDTCLSCFSHLFNSHLPFTFNLAELGRYYRAYQATMEHWRDVLPPGVMLDLNYEDVVSDLPGQARRVLAHCGLAWDPRCLDFHRTERTVRSASMNQVRQPLYDTAVGRWRPVAPFLGPLFSALGRQTTDHG